MLLAQSSSSSLPGMTKPPSKPGSTGERICLAGDSAGGNLCFTVSLRAAAYGVRVPDGIMAAYPATMLQPTVSPSRLLSLMDPLLPLSVLSKCVSAYAGKRPPATYPAPELGPGGMWMPRSCRELGRGAPKLGRG